LGHPFQTNIYRNNFYQSLLLGITILAKSFSPTPNLSYSPDEEEACRPGEIAGPSNQNQEERPVG